MFKKNKNSSKQMLMAYYFTQGEKNYQPLSGNTDMTITQRAMDLARHRIIQMDSAKHRIIQAVWEKGIPIAGVNPQIWREDQCGALIHRYHYGNRDSKYGWEKDHIIPESLGGTNRLSNLRPLQWDNNASRQAGRLTCKVNSWI